MKKTFILATCCLFALNNSVKATESVIAPADVVATLQEEAVAEDVNNIEILPFSIEAGQTKTIKVLLNSENDSEFTAAQLDLYLPEGLEVAKRGAGFLVNLGSRAQGEDEFGKYDTHTKSVSAQKNGAVRLVIYSMDNTNFPGKSGDILLVTVKAADNLKSGVQDVAIKNVTLARTNGIKAQPADRVLSVVCGHPAEVALKGHVTKAVLNEVYSAVADSATIIDLADAKVDADCSIEKQLSNTLVYLPEGVESTATNMVSAGGQCANLALLDGANFAPKSDFTAAKASYTREVASEGWYSVCLPFAANMPEGVDVKKFLAFDVAQSVVNFDAAVAMEAGLPYIFKASAPVTFSGENVAVSAAVTTGEMMGTFTNLSADQVAGKYLLKADGKQFELCTEKSSVPAFSAFLSVASSEQNLNTSLGEVTGIEELPAMNGVGDVYNMGGVLVKKNAKNLNGLSNGVYIVNGKKIVK